MKKISIKINGKKISCEPGKSILDVAAENGIEIPTLCFHPDVEVKHHCGMCLVQVKGEENLKRACGTEAKDKMEITTESPAITGERKKNLDEILKKHLLECDDCVWFQHCRLLELVKKFNAKPIAEKDDRNQVLQSGIMVFDQTKCIGCENCIDVCPTKFLSLNERQKVQLSDDPKKDCINCGQCILHCPVGAMEAVGEFEELGKVLKDKTKVVAVQFAPSIRTSIGEEFGMKPGEIATGKLVSGLKKLGFDYVFDTAAGADFTTMEESDEFIERVIEGKCVPAMSSCCPAWVKFMEFYHPDYLPHLCNSRSPQIMLGGIIKNYWARKNKIDPKNVFVVSIMPCVAKKFEIKREEMKIDGVYPVDQVLTTRELVRLFKANKIDFKNLDEQEADNPLGDPSGAGVIYGASGGVFESVLRTAYYKMTKENFPEDGAKEIRTMDGLKKKEFNLKGRKVKTCVVNGLKNAGQILEELKNNPGIYEAVEVMACPGGCVGGGGQSLPTNKKIVEQRGKSLYAIDSKKVRKGAHEDPAVKELYKEFFAGEENREKMLHTKFSARKKSEIKKLKNSREPQPW
jgi:iron-only hydrogenase group A